MTGTLFLCATPIGNLEDITLRVLKLLKTVDYIAAEDTRHTLKLLNHFQITTPLISYHEHNKKSKGPVLIEKLKQGASIALVTDAGMPGISDPGEDLVRLCYENKVPLTVAPGAAAVVTALVLSGLSTRRFLFEGFLPVEKKQRRKILEDLKNQPRTVVLYEAPHHLRETLSNLAEVAGSRPCAVIRELTKKFEQVKKGTVQQMYEYYQQNDPKGEFVIVIEGVCEQQLLEQERSQWKELSIEEHMEYYLKKEMPEKEAMKQVAKDRGVSKRDIYRYLTDIRNSSRDADE